MRAYEKARIKNRRTSLRKANNFQIYILTNEDERRTEIQPGE
jgi:hypothetical protein